MNIFASVIYAAAGIAAVLAATAKLRELKDDFYYFSQDVNRFTDSR